MSNNNSTNSNDSTMINNSNSNEREKENVSFSFEGGFASHADGNGFSFGEQTSSSPTQQSSTPTSSSSGGGTSSGFTAFNFGNASNNSPSSFSSFSLDPPPTTTTQCTTNSGFGFSIPSKSQFGSVSAPITTSPSTTSSGFGNLANTSRGTFGFGTPTQPTSTSSTGLSFVSALPTTTSCTPGSTSTSTTSVSTPPEDFNFGCLSNTTSSSGSGLSFAPTTSMPTTTFGFNSSGATNTGFGFGSRYGDGSTSGFGTRTTGFGSTSASVDTDLRNVRPFGERLGSAIGFGTRATGFGSTETSSGFGGFRTHADRSAASFSFGSPPVAVSNKTIVSGFKLQNYLDDKETSDVELQYGEDASIHCHTFLLSMISPVMKQSIEVTRNEKNSSGIQVTRICLPDTVFLLNSGEPTAVSEKAFRSLLEVMYGKDVEINSTDELVNLYLLAARFKVQYLQEEIEIQLKKKLQHDTTDVKKKLLAFALKSKDQDLTWLVLKSIKSQEFDCMDIVEWEDTEEEFFIHFIQSNRLPVSDEYSVLKNVHKWLKKRSALENATRTYLHIVNYVRFPFVSLPGLVKEVKSLQWLTALQLLKCMEYRVAQDSRLLDVQHQIEKDSEVQDDTVKLNFEPRDSYKVVDIDLLFMCDSTGSMSQEISIARDTIKNIMKELSERCRGTIRFALIGYRDHTDAETIQSFPFTTDMDKARGYVDTLQATGGGDYPEALAAALYSATKMEFNENAKKICVLIGDAPPHGMGVSGDSYPDGDPNGHDWLKLSTELNDRGVTFYTLVCERAKSCNYFTLFMDTVAQKTSGKCILLTQADKLPDVIINGTSEDLEVESVVSKFIKDLGDISELSQEELNKKIEEHIKQNKIKVDTTDVFTVTNAGTSALLNANQITSEHKTSLFGATGSSTFASSGAGGFSFGSTTYQAPSKQAIYNATSKFV
jgi:Mg-chelatase subunit ChlD